VTARGPDAVLANAIGDTITTSVLETSAIELWAMTESPAAFSIGPADSPTISTSNGSRPGLAPSSGATSDPTELRISNNPLTGETIASGVATMLVCVADELMVRV
jgi:hypothetical protein